MTNIIVYGSTTGNCENLANVIADHLRKIGGEEVVLKNASETNANEIAQYDRIFIGSSTWGDGDLQDDIQPFYDELSNINLNGKATFAFGVGESTWAQFCKAVDLIKERLIECGAVCNETLKIDGEVNIQDEKILNWVENAYKKVV